MGELDVGGTLPVERQIETQGVVDLEHQSAWDLAEPHAKALHGNRSDLFGLRLRVAFETRRTRRKEHLERIDALRVRGDRDHRHDAATEPRGAEVRPVVADD